MSSQDVRVQPLFTEQSSAAARGGGQIGKHHQKAPDGQAQPGRIQFGGGRLADQQQSSKHRAAEELDFRQLREELEADIEKFSKASRPEAANNAPAGMVVKGISRCSDPPQMEGRQFAKGPRPTEGQEEQHAPNVRGGYAEAEARHPKFPPASSVRPSPPLPTVDLPVMLSSRYSSLKVIERVNSVFYRPAGRTAISMVTMCLRAPNLRQHLPESIHGPIGICLLQDKCVVVSSTFEDQVGFASFQLSTTMLLRLKCSLVVVNF